MRTLVAVILLGGAAAGSAAEGAVRPEEVALESLPQRGEIRTAEGFIRAEGPDPGGAPGSFGTYHPAARRPAAHPGGAAAVPVDAAPAELAAAERRARTDPCRPERDRYLRQLFRAAGIDLERPGALLQALAGPGGYTGEYLFTAYGLLAGLEPMRPLAWDADLRLAADELAECGEQAPPGR